MSISRIESASKKQHRVNKAVTKCFNMQYKNTPPISICILRYGIIFYNSTYIIIMATFSRRLFESKKTLD